jgi:2-polyprenyl-3-methyl-5-hydroxy-6-metoxy-1,4-benzoquinol methylase
MNEHQIATIIAYDKSARQYSEKIASLNNYNECYDYLLSKLNVGNEILDLACGPGNISRYLLGKLKLRVTGYDLSNAMLEIARVEIPEGQFEIKSIVNFETPTKFEMVINGFGLPYITKQQRLSSFECSFNSLKPGGHFFLSFMNGDKEGYEITSYNPNEKFYIHYHKHEEVSLDLEKSGFTIIKQWEFDYHETDGSITKDIAIVAKGCPLHIHDGAPDQVN